MQATHEEPPEAGEPKRDGPAPRRASRLPRGVLASVASLAIFLLLAEGGARLAGFAPAVGEAPAFTIRGLSGLYFAAPGRSETRVRKKPVRINAMGLRGGPVGLKPPGSVRALFLGDSVTFGFEVAEAEIYPVRVQNMLRRRGVKLDVVNASIPSWSRRQHRLFLEKFGRRVDPDLIIFSVVLNDIPELAAGTAQLESSILVGNALSWLAARSAFGAALKQAAAASSPGFLKLRELYVRLDRSIDDPDDRELVERELTETQALIDLARSRGLPIAALLIPMKFQLDSTHDPAIQRELRAYLAKQGVPVLDLLPVLRGEDPKTVFIDHVHLTEKGHRLVATTLVPWLERNDLLRQAGLRRRSGRGEQSGAKPRPPPHSPS